MPASKSSNLSGRSSPDIAGGDPLGRAFHPGGGRNHHSDDGAAQMLLELHVPFDVIDASGSFETYQVLVLPDEIPVDADLAARFKAFVAGAAG